MLHHLIPTDSLHPDNKSRQREKGSFPGAHPEKRGKIFPKSLTHFYFHFPGQNYEQIKGMSSSLDKLGHPLDKWMLGR